MATKPPIKLTRSKYFDRSLFYDVSTHEVWEDYPLHWHDFYEIEYIMEGNSLHEINRIGFPAKPGHLALLSPVDFHEFKNVKSDDRLWVCNIKFSDSILPPNLCSDLYAQRAPMTCQLDPNLFTPFFLKVHWEYEHPGYGRDLMLKSAIVQICVTILRNMKGVDASGTQIPRTAIQEAVLYVRTHFRKPLTIDQMSDLVHLTPNYFSEYFKRQTGENFSAYVQKLRLEFALSLLRVTQLSVKEIAEESGFHSPAYFSNAFKDHYGMSPDLYRRKKAEEDSHTPIENGK